MAAIETQWNWSGLDKETGAPAHGRVAATNVEEARTVAAAAAPEAVIVEVRRRSAAAAALSEQSFRARRDDTAALFRGLATSVAAGLSTREALEMEREDTEQRGASTAALAADLYDRVLVGETLENALRRHTPTLGPVPSAVAEAGDRSGTLPDMLDGLAQMMEQNHEIRSKLRSAMIYPVFSLVIVLLVAAVGVLYVVPQFTQLLTITGDETLPQPTAAMVGISDAMRSHWWLFIIGGVATAIGGGVALTRPVVRDMLSGAVLSLPGFGVLVQGAATAVICQMMSLLLSTGLEPGQATRLTAEAVPQRRMRSKLRDVEANVLRGTPFGAALKAVTPPLDRRLEYLARQSAKVANPGEPWRGYGERVNAETRRRMETVQQMIQPLMTLVVGGVLLLVGLGITRPLLKVYQGF